MTPAVLGRLYLAIVRRVDGGTLVAEALADPAGAWTGCHVLGIGKVAVPMFEGFTRTAGPPATALLIAPDGPAPAGTRLVPGDHPVPTARSLAAAASARAFVAAVPATERLVVLLSGGGSALMAEPRAPLALADKVAAVSAVARAGATISQLNTVRKHLSAIKGGRLALATRARVTVMAVSDVVGNDPGTIASGPFSADDTTFAQAHELVRRLAPDATAAGALLAQGAAGALPETPKPGDPRLAHVDYRVIAGHRRLIDEARACIEASGWRAGALPIGTEAPIDELADEIAARARSEASRPRVLVGGGEPRIVVTGGGRGGRATHLALLVARAIAGRPDVAFLAAGTDARDGSADASGAVVDGSTWQRAVANGLDPEAALEARDSARALAAVGCLVRGPGRSNVLDLHLLALA